MAPLSIVMPPIFATSAILASSSSSHDSNSASGVPFGTALLIALGATLGLILVPFILYAVIASLIRRCRARRARRRDATAPGEDAARDARSGGAGLVNGSWPRAEPMMGTPREPLGPPAVEWPGEHPRNGSMVWRTTAERNPVSRPWGMIFPRHWKGARLGNSNVSRDCEKGTAGRKKPVEEKENIVSAFVGFLKSWARVEGDGRS